jgi:hypothetical protein
MIDKLDLEVPRRMPFRADFARAWNNPQNDDLFKKRTGGLYQVTADLRGVGIDALLEIGHKHHEKLGPKLQILGAGEKNFSDWAAIHDAIFKGEAYDDAILRADLTGDVRGVPVTSFGRAMWCKFKHTNQQHYGEYQHLDTTYNRFGAQTLFYGRKPRQVRFYDKTRHRLQVLLPDIHRKQRQRDEQLATFREVWGYDPSEIVTRAERQMGDRETAKAWNVCTFGEIPQLMKCDPWERLHFADGAKARKREKIDGGRRIAIELLREKIETEGLDRARAYAMGLFDKSNSWRTWWRRNEHLIVDTAPEISRETLTRYYRESLTEQLAA